jgi:hypothetical protein
MNVADEKEDTIKDKLRESLTSSFGRPYKKGELSSL